MASIFKTVCCDDEHGFSRNVLFSSISMDIYDMLDRRTNGIQKSRTASWNIFLSRQKWNCVNIHPIMDAFDAGIKENRCDIGISSLLLLLLDKAVKPADSVSFESMHRSAVSARQK